MSYVEDDLNQLMDNAFFKRSIIDECGKTISEIETIDVAGLKKYLKALQDAVIYDAISIAR